MSDLPKPRRLPWRDLTGEPDARAGGAANGDDEEQWHTGWQRDEFGDEIGSPSGEED